jgi:hypothetical protein
MKTMMQENSKKRTWMNAGKKLFILLFSLGLAFGASAQRGGHFAGGGRIGGFYGGGYYPRTYVGVGFGLGYPWGYPYGWYGPWYAPYPAWYYGYGAMPNQLELQVQDIRRDFDAQIKDVKHDKALTHKEKRQKIDQLKQDREGAIVQARHDYFNHNRNNYNNRNNNGNGGSNQPNQNNQQPKNNNNGSSSDGPEYQDKNGQTGTN